MGLARPGRLDHGPTLLDGQAAYAAAAPRAQRAGPHRPESIPRWSHHARGRRARHRRPPAGWPRPTRRWRRRSGGPGAGRRCRRPPGTGSATLGGTGWPVTAASSSRADSLMQMPSEAGPTMSPSTAPASTEASCSGSPTRMRRASGRTASTSRAIIESETIEVSSTTTTSCGSRFSRLCRKRVRLPGLKPRSRCKRHSGQGAQPPLHLFVDRHGPRARPHRLFETGGCLAGRRGQGDEGRTPARRRRLFVEEGEDTGHRGRLAGSRSAGHDRDRPEDGHGRRHALEVGQRRSRRRGGSGQRRGGSDPRRPAGVAARSLRSCATCCSSVHNRSR